MHICEATGWPPPYPSLQPASLVFNQVYLLLPLFFTSQEKSPSLSPVSVFCGHILKRLRDWLWCKQVKVHLTYRDIVLPFSPSTLQIVTEVTETTLCIGGQ